MDVGEREEGPILGTILLDEALVAGDPCQLTSFHAARPSVAAQCGPHDAVLVVPLPGVVGRFPVRALLAGRGAASGEQEEDAADVAAPDAPPGGVDRFVVPLADGVAARRELVGLILVDTGTFALGAHDAFAAYSFDPEEGLAPAFHRVRDVAVPTWRSVPVAVAGGRGLVFANTYGDGAFGVYVVRDAAGRALRVELPVYGATADDAAREEEHATAHAARRGAR